MPQFLSDSVIDEHLPSEKETLPGPTELRQTVVEVCDVLGQELKARFGKDQATLWMQAFLKSRSFDVVVPLCEIRSLHQENQCRAWCFGKPTQG